MGRTRDEVSVVGGAAIGIGDGATEQESGDASVRGTGSASAEVERLNTDTVTSGGLEGTQDGARDPDGIITGLPEGVGTGDGGDLGTRSRFNNSRAAWTLFRESWMDCRVC